MVANKQEAIHLYHEIEQEAIQDVAKRPVGASKQGAVEVVGSVAIKQTLARSHRHPHLSY